MCHFGIGPRLCLSLSFSFSFVSFCMSLSQPCTKHDPMEGVRKRHQNRRGGTAEDERDPDVSASETRLCSQFGSDDQRNSEEGEPSDRRDAGDTRRDIWLWASRVASHLRISVAQRGFASVVESVKATSDINFPVSGKVVEVNEVLSESPGLVNTSPYEDGWIIKVELSDAGEVEKL
ncbi:unnamed protein product [Brassica oleracea]